MPLCLYGRSSMEFWESYRAEQLRCCRTATFEGVLSSPAAPGRAYPDDLYECAPRVGELAEMLEGRLAGFARPLHLLAPLDSVRRRVPHAVVHASHTVLTGESILDAGGGLFVSSPAQCLVQIAPSLEPAEIAFYASALCGSYVLTDEGRCVSFALEPLATVARLDEELACLRSVNASFKVRGLEKVRRALKHAVDDAASPAEIVLELLLCLPCSLGGYGLPQPQVNGAIGVPRGRRALAERDAYRPDLFWEKAGLIVEYNGEESHGKRRASLDARRNNSLVSLDYDVMQVTYGQLGSTACFDLLARQIARKLSSRLQGCRRIKDWPERRDALRKCLLPLVAERPSFSQMR